MDSIDSSLALSCPRGLYIVFEGIDGSGKSTQIELLRQRLTLLDQQVEVTHEPTNAPIGMLIQDIMKAKVSMNPASIAALFAADRLDHILNENYGMLRALEQGSHVINSRYYFSSYAFQGEYLPLDWIIALNSRSKEILRADITFYLNVDPRVCNSRISDRKGSREIYENLEKLQKTHQTYLETFESLGADEHIVLIDGEQSIEGIASDIWSHCQPLMPVQHEE